MSWFLVHTKPRQEARAQVNLQDQRFKCWLPRLRAEKVVRGKLVVVDEPLFPRYLFIEVEDGQNWSPVRSTPGVTTIVRFGGVPGRVPAEVVEVLQAEEQARFMQPARLRYARGQPVLITSGPFAGVRAVFDMADGDARALVLIELLSRPAKLPVPLSSLLPAHETDLEAA